MVVTKFIVFAPESELISLDAALEAMQEITEGGIGFKFGWSEDEKKKPYIRIEVDGDWKERRSMIENFVFSHAHNAEVVFAIEHCADEPTVIWRKEGEDDWQSVNINARVLSVEAYDPKKRFFDDYFFSIRTFGSNEQNVVHKLFRAAMPYLKGESEYISLKDLKKVLDELAPASESATIGCELNWLVDCSIREPSHTNIIPVKWIDG